MEESFLFVSLFHIHSVPLSLFSYTVTDVQMYTYANIYEMRNGYVNLK